MLGLAAISDRGLIRDLLAEMSAYAGFATRAASWMLAGLLFGCAQRPPVSVSQCNARIVPSKSSVRGGTVIAYSFALKNESARAVAAVRINFQTLSFIDLGIPFDKTRPGITYDYEQRLQPGGSAIARARTDGLPFTRFPVHSQKVQCNIVSLRYADGSTWAIGRGIVAPSGPAAGHRNPL